MPAARASVRWDAPTSDRVAALDALRVVSMAAVVALHASAAYMTVRIPGLIWLVNEPAGSEFVQQFAWWAYGATMPAFFALAGYAAAAVLEVKGTRGYALDRACRIGLPFLAAIPAVLIPTVLIWMLGLYLAGRCEVAELLALSFADGQIQANRFGPAHLWFLAYLIPMLALLGVVQSWCREQPRSLHGVLSHFCSPLTPLMLAIPTTLILWLGHWWNGVDPILDLRNSFLINPIRWLHHSLFFIAGLGWHSGRTRLPADPGASALAVPRGLGRRALGPGKMAASRPRGLLDGIGRLGVGRLGVALRLADALWVARRVRAPGTIWRPSDQVPLRLLLLCVPGSLPGRGARSGGPLPGRASQSRQVPARVCDRPGLEPSHLRGLRSPHLDWPVAAWWRPRVPSVPRPVLPRSRRGPQANHGLKA